MPYGIIINCVVVALGGILGSILGKYIPRRICDFLSKFFGITSITIGITLMIKMNSLSAVMLSLILGAIVGEGFCLEDKLQSLSIRLKSLAGHLIMKNGIATNLDQSTEKFVGVLILICTGSTGLMGAMTEAMTNDASILIAKSVLDLFGGAIFASTMGISISLIAIPQFLIYITLFLLSRFIIPFTTPYMVADFMACGGVIAFVTGLRIAEIKSMNVSSLLPALLFVMPISLLWTLVFG